MKISKNFFFWSHVPRIIQNWTFQKKGRKNQVKGEINILEQQENDPEYMNSTFSLQELEKAIGTLKDCKSPGPDKITNL